MKRNILRTSNLTKKYDKYLAANDVNIEIKEGDIYGLIGKNGAGKTTLLKMISGLTIPTSGEIQLFGETSESGINKSRMRTGAIIESPSFFPYMSAKKNLEHYRIQRGIPGKKIIDEVLSFVGLEEVGNKKFKDFSLGMKQRLGLALTLLSSPDLLILDEPINGLDPTGIIEFRQILLKLNREKNITIIVSSHILEELSQIATSYGFINEGKIIEQISAKELEEKFKRFIKIKVDDSKKASTIIENKLKCMEYEVLSDNEIRIYQKLDIPEIINKTLVENGVMVFSINQEGLHLEDYFINLIGGGKNA